ncbi:rhomboid family intramembrane serine protease [Natrinema salinisoli]|uniref:rhomboid family intramembrane serine protease n=1 Tax=Natrinema salinisoli TaxID=2878535 RepID=UPI001CEFB2BC|nr:rhomboid family intramembrane serine protease [Natrinema salinisoli]
MTKPLRESPATIGFLTLVWSLYGIRLLVESRVGHGVASSVFVVQYTNLEYVWTWFTAPFGHVNVVHLLVNSLLALYIIPESERTFGFKTTGVGFVLGGAMTAVLGTVFVGMVRSPFLTAVSASGMGSSMGLFVLLGMILERYRSYRVPIRGIRRLRIRNSTYFVVLLLVSLFGVGFDIWREVTEFSFPGLGHGYHVVGLLIGWAFSRLLDGSYAIRTLRL